MGEEGRKEEKKAETTRPERGRINCMEDGDGEAAAGGGLTGLTSQVRY